MAPTILMIFLPYHNLGFIHALNEIPKVKKVGLYQVKRGLLLEDSGGTSTLVTRRD